MLLGKTPSPLRPIISQSPHHSVSQHFRAAMSSFVCKSRIAEQAPKHARPGLTADGSFSQPSPRFSRPVYLFTFTLLLLLVRDCSECPRGKDAGS
jgi:hypothetical protein